MRQEIAATLMKFFSGRALVADLREALARHTLNVALTGSDEERDFVGELELALAEYEAGHISFDELASRIAPRINGLIIMGSPDLDIRTEAQTDFHHQQWTAEVNILPSLELASSISNQ